MAPIAASLSLTEVGVPISFSANITDGVNVSQYGYSGLPSGCTSATALSVRCTPTSPGSFNVSLSALDALGVHASESIPVRVAARASVGSFTLSRNVVDVGMATSVVATVNGGVGPFGVGYAGLPNGCASSNALAITCRPIAPGTFGLSVEVTDSLKVTASSSTTLTVNSLPAIRSVTLSRPSIEVGGSSTISVNLTGGTAPYALVYPGLPEGCASANTTQLVCAPSASVSGNFTIVVTATDAVGVMSMGRANLSVEATITQPHGGTPSTGLPPFVEGAASGAALFAIVVSAFLVRTRMQAAEGRRLAEELERGVASEGVGLADEPGSAARSRSSIGHRSRRTDIRRGSHPLRGKGAWGSAPFGRASFPGLGTCPIRRRPLGRPALVESFFPHRVPTGPVGGSRPARSYGAGPAFRKGSRSVTRAHRKRSGRIESGSLATECTASDPGLPEAPRRPRLRRRTRMGTFEPPTGSSCTSRDRAEPTPAISRRSGLPKRG